MLQAESTVYHFEKEVGHSTEVLFTMGSLWQEMDTTAFIRPTEKRNRLNKSGEAGAREGSGCRRAAGAQLRGPGGSLGQG